MDVDRIWETVICIILAAAGGLSRLLSKKDNTRLRLGRMLSELFVSGFAGLMVLLLGRSLGLDGNWLGLVCGMAGWVGPKILDLVMKPAGNAIGINTDDLKKKK